MGYFSNLFRKIVSQFEEYSSFGLKENIMDIKAYIYYLWFMKNKCGHTIFISSLKYKNIFNVVS